MKNMKPIEITTQKSTFGGSVSLPMQPIYMTKTACEIKAFSLIANEEVTGMTMLEIAKEIYAHAQCYYNAATLKALGVENDMVDELYERANPIDIEDGGDTFVRKTFYNLLWMLSSSAISPYSVE